jgi:REP element-mobilizing transposase RayT
MRGKRELAENVWYYIVTGVNDCEPLFWSVYTVRLLARVLREVRERYAFEIRGLRFDGAEVSFYIRPADGLKLPEIMKLVKQTFAVRFNLLDGRKGHIWGDRYLSEILDGEPPEEAVRYEFITITLPVRRGEWRREAVRMGFKRDAGNRKCCRLETGRGGQTPAPVGRGNPPCSGYFYWRSDSQPV